MMNQKIFNLSRQNFVPYSACFMPSYVHVGMLMVYMVMWVCLVVGNQKK